MNLNKYDIPKPVKPPIDSWTESVPVIQLSEYLKMQGSMGIKLCHDDGVPCLCFIQGTRDLSVVEATAGLFEAAADDLMELISNGNLTIPIKQRVLPCDLIHTDGKTAGIR